MNRREASKRAFIPNATLSVLGTIQPKALPTIFSDLDAATGFLPRFLFVSPIRETPPLWTDETVSTTTCEYLTFIFEKLLSLDFDEQSEPVIIGVEHEAKRLYEYWFNEQVLEPWQDVDAAVYEAVLAKLRGQCLRIALILHCLEAVDAGKPDTAPVNAETMERAITLAKCLKAHQRNAWQTIVNQGQVAELPPLHRQVARAILSLEGEIIGGMLPTARITERVNQTLDPRFHVSAKSVGKTAKQLGFNTGQLPDGEARGFTITNEALQKLRFLFQTNVENIGNIDKPNTTWVFRDNSNVGETSETSDLSSETNGVRHFRHLSDPCETCRKPQSNCISDVSDVSDISLRELKI